MADFRRYRVWQLAHELTLLVYRVTKPFPTEERYGITAQLRRSAVSIPSNIAEGFGRSGDRDRARFLDICVGSANELEYQLLLSKDLGYLGVATHDDTRTKLVELRKSLSSLLVKLRT
jgi:four helix bundle protein